MNYERIFVRALAENMLSFPPEVISWTLNSERGIYTFG